MPLHTLARPADAQGLRVRLGHLTPDADRRRRWGRMTVHEMLCHLADTFRTGLGENPIPTPMRVLGLRGPVVKWISLSLPIPWPHGVRGPAEVDPKRQGTRPAEFAADLARAEATMGRFIGEVNDRVHHPLFGAMARSDWLRWGWLHVDHHLRQFGD